MNTLFLLMAEFNTGEIPLKDICEKHLGMDISTATKRANKAKLPFPCHKNGTQKSELLVDINDLAKHIDDKKVEAKEEWEKVNAA